LGEETIPSEQSRFRIQFPLAKDSYVRPQGTGGIELSSPKAHKPIKYLTYEEKPKKK
jgi:hypothetical protein